ncbi:hypothetical protein EJV47_25635 [Hymenobacter gummosus]|uniref:Uncharacterized protein n=1 Tax=Hymenobacter gummosus TaxID=1776032 RepID=A0A431TUS1_9BACT|nr:hypothetical protein [Hymenobacter gummosus]RTQ45263.1 hypothetical protein EJV47_25635 [Hymenobacter gummosus]
MDVPTPFPNWFLTTQYTLNLISSFGVLIPLAIGLRRWGILSPAARIIVGYFGFWSLEAFVDQWSRRVLHTNMYLFHVTVLVETLLLGWAYYQVYDLKPVRRIMPWVGVAFTLVALADAFWINDLQHENAVARVVQVSLMLAMILLYFEQWVREMRTDNPWHNFMFLVSVGLAIYYAGSVMSYLGIASGGFAAIVMAIIIDLSFIVALVLMTVALWREAFPSTAYKAKTA